MISRLPRWIWLGAWLLALVGGMVNVTGFLGFQHQAVTHLTGTTTLMAAAVVDGDGAEALHFAVMIGAFVAGAVLSSIITRDSALQLGRHYGVALLAEALLLGAAPPLLQAGFVSGFYLAAGACGLQNGMMSTYSGAMIRTTHLSGMLTDLGIFLGHLARGTPFDRRRLRLCGLIISGFFCGGLAGAVAFRHLRYAALYLPAALVAAMAAAYSVYSARRSATAGLPARD